MMTRNAPFLKRFTVYSFLLIAGFATFACVLVGREVTRIVTLGNARVFAAGANGLVSEEVDTRLLGSSPSPSFTKLGRDVEHRIAQGNVVALRILTPTGTVLFSADPTEVGTVLPPSKEIERAAGGKLGVSVVQRKDDPILPASAGQVMRVTCPVETEGDAKPQALIQMYKPFEPISASIHDSLLTVWLAIGLGALGAYLSLVVIVKRAQSAIATREDEVDELDDRLERSMRNMERQSLGILQALGAAVDAKDSYTARHSLGVTNIAFAIGRRLGLRDEDLLSLERASLLHDIGKIGIAESVLLKPSRLTDAEFDAVREHAEMGAGIIESIPFLREIVPIVRHHHERFDGRGYPAGLSGEGIPLLARILAAADSYDAMTSDRPYRSAMNAGLARQEMIHGAGTQFDPDVVDALLAALDAGEVRQSRQTAQRARRSTEPARVAS